MAKVLVAGASNVGKTSLVNSLVFQGFFHVSPTIGVNFAQKVCIGDAGPVSLSIWDLSGHSRFRCLMPRFCTGATGVMLVFDLNNPESLSKCAEWLNRISSYINPPTQYTAVLIGNKSDLPPQISPSEIEKFCNLYNISDYVQCSAKSGENVKQAFETLCSAMQHNNPNLMATSRIQIAENP
ncbi:MAG: Rab family GTPase [Promethearchaeota archaeon]